MKNIATLNLIVVLIICMYNLSHAQEIFEQIVRGDKAIVERILSETPKIISERNESGNTPLHVAVINNQAEIAKLLLEYGAAVEAKNKYDRSPLLAGIIRGAEVEVCKILIENGADINTTDPGANTPIEQANQRGKSEILGILLQRGANLPNDENKLKMMIHFAVINGHNKLTEELIESGIYIYEKNLYDGTLLHNAAIGGNIKMAEYFLDKEFDIDFQDRYGFTPLHYAVMNGKNEMIEFLIAQGADLNMKSYSGKSMYNLAVEQKDSAIIEMLNVNGVDTISYVFPSLNGKYLGQTVPHLNPQIFAPGIVSDLSYDHCVPAFSKNYEEVFWAKGYDKIMTMKRVYGKWTEPFQASFSISGNDANVAFSPDGNRLYFLSKRPIGDESNTKFRLWFVERTDNGWSESQLLDGQVNSASWSMHFSFADNGNLYIGGNDIYLIEFKNDEYAVPVRLPSTINSGNAEFSPFISPDESYIIFTRYVDGGGFPHISFKNDNGTWGEAVNLSQYTDVIGEVFSCTISPDGKYFFFTKGQAEDMDVYWVDAKIINHLRLEQK